MTENKDISKNPLKIDAIVDDPSIPKIYANGVLAQLTLADGVIVFQHYKKTVCMVSASLPLIKSLRDNLTTIIEAYESGTGSEIVPIQQIAEKIKSKKNG